MADLTQREGKWDDSEGSWTQEFDERASTSPCPELVFSERLTRSQFANHGLLRKPKQSHIQRGFRNYFNKVPTNREVDLITEAEPQPDFNGGEPGLYLLERCGGDTGPGLPSQLGRDAFLCTTYPFRKAGGILRLGEWDPEKGYQEAWTQFAIRGEREHLVELQWVWGQRAKSLTAGRIPAYATVRFPSSDIPQMFQVVSQHCLLRKYVTQEAIADLRYDLLHCDQVNVPELPHLLSAPETTYRHPLIPSDTFLRTSALAGW